MLNSIQLKKLNTFRHTSPPNRKPNAGAASPDAQVPAEEVTLSAAARDNKKSGMSTMAKVGLTVGVAAAVGGAFVAGGIMSQPEEVTLESQFQDMGRDWKRGMEDLRVEAQRAKEDFETEFRRGYNDAQNEPDESTQFDRDFEDATRGSRT